MSAVEQVRPTFAIGDAVRYDSTSGMQFTGKVTGEQRGNLVEVRLDGDANPYDQDIATLTLLEPAPPQVRADAVLAVCAVVQRFLDEVIEAPRSGALPSPASLAEAHNAIAVLRLAAGAKLSTGHENTGPLTSEAYAEALVETYGVPS